MLVQYSETLLSLQCTRLTPPHVTCMKRLLSDNKAHKAHNTYIAQ